MRWIVEGADIKTGKDRVAEVEASSKLEAEARGRSLGMLIAEANPVAENPNDDPLTVLAEANRTRFIGTRPRPNAPSQTEAVVHHVQSGTIHVQIKGVNALGVAALVIGIIAAVVSWIPYIGLVAIPLCAIAFILALIGLIIALVGGKSGVGFPVAALIVAMLSAGISVVSTGAVAKRIASFNTINQTAVSGANSVREDSVVASPPLGTQVQQDGMQVAVVSPKILGAGKDARLQILLDVSNQSTNRKYDFMSWNGARFSMTSDAATLHDDVGNSYHLIWDGPFDRRSLYPTDKVQDHLTFEVPVESIKYLDLELPASNFGGSGTLKLRIPLSMIDRSTTPPSPPSHKPDVRDLIGP